ncbi:Z-ring formation inhibitor MciZ [Neobacillus vireti]
MKVYVHDKGIILVGKGWEIIQKLKEYNKNYSTVAEWVENVSAK